MPDETISMENDLQAHLETLVSAEGEVRNEQSRLTYRDHEAYADKDNELKSLREKIDKTVELMTERREVGMQRIQNFILDREGIERDDPELQMIINKGIEAGETWEIDAWKEKLESFADKRNKQLSVSTGAVVGSAGRNVGEPGRAGDLLSQIAELQRHPSQNWDEIQELMTEGRKSGIFG